MAARGRLIVTTPAWRAAVEAAGGQCQRAGKAGRCSRTLNGGYRLYLDDDGRVYCSDHHGPSRPAAPVHDDAQQDALF